MLFREKVARKSNINHVKVKDKKIGWVWNSKWLVGFSAFIVLQTNSNIFKDKHDT